MPEDTSNSLFRRDVGLLLHPTSLPGPYGVGDFGPPCLRWVEWLAEAKQSLWQILPLCPTGFGDSPYQGLSAFAANPVLLSPDTFLEQGLITTEEREACVVSDSSQVDYEQASERKQLLSARVSQRFVNHPFRDRFDEFVDQQSDWLDDFAMFSALKARFEQKAWLDWPAPYRDRHTAALAEASKELAEAIELVQIQQFFLRQQWDTVHAAAREQGIRIVGDLPIFVAHDSVDVWCQRDLFQLIEDGSPRVIAGVPPDYFSATGQRWGNPLYDWPEHEADAFSWWRKRVRKILDWVDIVRIDHFRGFAAYWEVDGKAETAMDGRWVPAPGQALFETLADDLGTPLPIVAEDLGVISEDVVALRDNFNLPGIRIFQFAFGTDPMKDTFIPEAYIPNCVAYTGTHDNDTIQGWFNSTPGQDSTRDAEAIAEERASTLSYFGGDGTDIHRAFIERLYASVAGAVVIPVQDVLGLGSEARMNCPGQSSGHWRWRLKDFDALFREREYLLALAEASNRGRS